MSQGSSSWKRVAGDARRKRQRVTAAIGPRREIHGTLDERLERKSTMFSSGGNPVEVAEAVVGSDRFFLSSALGARAQSGAQCGGCEDIQQSWQNLQNTGHLAATVSETDISGLTGITQLETSDWFLLVPAVGLKFPASR
jgi:hypothetical protein